MEREPGQKPTIKEKEMFAARMRHRNRFSTTPTEIPGVSARHEPSMAVDLPRRTAWRLLDLAVTLYRIKSSNAELAKEKGEAEKEAKGIVNENEGLRGIESEAHNLGLSIVPSVDWDIELLRQSLGSRFSTYVEEQVVAEFDPSALANARGPFTQPRIENLLTRAFGHRGIPEKRSREGVRVETKYKVHSDTLEKAIASGEVSLVEGAVTIGRTYTFKADPLHETNPIEPQN